MFAVVKFPLEDCVEVVASSWLRTTDDGQILCAWPSYGSAGITRAVREQERPKKDQSWTEYEAVVVRKYS
jgi:hypothetical protein